MSLIKAAHEARAKQIALDDFTIKVDNLVHNRGLAKEALNSEQANLLSMKNVEDENCMVSPGIVAGLCPRIGWAPWLDCFGDWLDENSHCGALLRTDSGLQTATTFSPRLLGSDEHFLLLA